MKLPFFMLFTGLTSALLSAQETKPHRLTPVPIQQVVIEDDFWSPKLKVWRDVTIGDCFTKFENDRGGAINNFDLVRDGKAGRHAGPEWYDGLIYEMIRGAADFLAAQRDPALEARLDGYIARIVAAQAKDPGGYINTWTQTMAPQTQRWGMNGGDDRSQHDVYNSGAMIEAGVHYYRATGHTALLEAATRMANLMCDTIGPPPKANVIPGHSLSEEALVKLYRLYRENPEAKRSVKVPVDEERYLKLAEFFIDARGHYEGRTGRNKSYGEYGQDQAPLAQQQTLEGHAVRATLFCTGIAAAARVNNRADYLTAAQRFWDSFVRHRMYLTGAAGAIGGDEKFGPDYFLPNNGYMETCAAVGGGFFNRNMNLLFGEARYDDVLEQALYNAALGGVALAGNRYYYQNPLVGDGLRRWEWHECPCCPPMFLKIMGALPGYIYAQEPGAVYVNLFVGSRATLTLNGAKVGFRQTTRYPWDGGVKIAIEQEKPAEFELFIRIPAWCQGASLANDLYQVVGRPADGAATLKVNGRSVGKLEMVRGYARLRRQWKTGDVVELSLDMPVRQVRAHPRIEADHGLVALMRGPVVYCVESVDNPEGIRHLIVPPEASFTAEFKPELLGGVAVVRGQVRACYAEAGRTRTASAELTAAPFYASANREPCSMRVWLPASADKAVPATLATRSRASASHCWHLDSVAAVNDGVVPAKSSDTSQPRLSWWDHKGTTEWAELDFPQATEVSKVRVFWFADRPVKGGCDLPRSWRLLYKDGDDWKPVARPSTYGLAPDRFNEVTFTRVRTSALRIEAQLQPEWSAGICEWQVE
jgi:DUF1680 family protein